LPFLRRIEEKIVFTLYCVAALLLLYYPWNALLIVLPLAGGWARQQLIHARSHWRQDLVEIGRRRR
jgi:hypothetical protein